MFTQVDEGNRLHRAVIGFGAGQTGLQLVVAIDDLAQGTPKPFYELDTSATSGKAPGYADGASGFSKSARLSMASP